MDQILQPITTYQKNNFNNSNDDIAAQICHQILSSAAKLKAINYLLQEMKEKAQPIPGEVIQIVESLVKELQSLGKSIHHLDGPENVKNIVPPQKFDLISLVEETVLPFTVQAPDRTISRDYQAGLLFAYGSREKTQIVLDNLLSNAIKYSPDGSPIYVRVNIYSIASSKQPGYAAVYISNFGSYIPSQEQKKIFNKYYRSNGHHQLGQGLGLYLAHRFVEMQNGQMDVKSHPVEGTTFWFTLPLNRC
ncbi:MAG: HAMP domain-containing histidine kinase [Anaerolineae bacterium]|nr:HAMP domain-containing histidine kinase [Anaerolineae bacterium]